MLGLGGRLLDVEGTGLVQILDLQIHFAGLYSSVWVEDRDSLMWKARMMENR